MQMFLIADVIALHAYSVSSAIAMDVEIDVIIQIDNPMLNAIPIALETIVD